MNVIGLGDYLSGAVDTGGSAFSGNQSQEELDQLLKSLTAGTDSGRLTANQAVAGSGSPLIVESLENTLKVLTHKMKDIRLWNMIEKIPAYAIAEEYNQLVSYGSMNGAFIGEGDLPKEENSTYTRKVELVKYMGVTKSVSHPMQLVKTMVGNIVAQETTNGTLYLLRQANKALVYGNASIVDKEWNGYYAQHRSAFTSFSSWITSAHVIDLRGKAIKDSDIEAGSLTIMQNFGFANKFVAPPAVLSNYVRRITANAKFITPNTPATTEAIMGQKAKQIVTQFGPIDLEYDIFMAAANPRLTTEAATNASAPAAPTVSAGAAASDAVLSKFAAGDAGDYFYAVASKNQYGESALSPFASSAVISVTAGQSVDLTFTIPANSGAVIYRSQKNPAGAIGVTNMYPILEVSATELSNGFDGGAAGKVRDRNRFLPGTDRAFLAQLDTDVLSFKQLAPLMKMDLAVISPAQRFMLLLYGTPQLYAPLRFVQYINIGSDIS